MCGRPCQLLYKESDVLGLKMRGDSNGVDEPCVLLRLLVIQHSTPDPLRLPAPKHIIVHYHRFIPTHPHRPTPHLIQISIAAPVANPMEYLTWPLDYMRPSHLLKCQGESLR